MERVPVNLKPGAAAWAVSELIRNGARRQLDGLLAGVAAQLVHVEVHHLPRLQAVDILAKRSCWYPYRGAKVHAF